jgi:hypothetical protein
MQRALDAEHLLRAWQDNRISVSRDLDYRELHVAWLRWPPAWGQPAAPPHRGILLIPSNWSIQTAAQELDFFVRTGQPCQNLLYHFVVGQGWQPYP